MMKQENSSEEYTSFGFKSVKRDEKASLVHEVFASVASKYDVMNDFMSAGLHRLWKDKMVSMLQVKPKARLLDVAGGTGDISFRFLQRAKDMGIPVEAVVSDINEHMLEEGRKRSINRNILSNISWELANAEELPFEDSSFSNYTIAFGIRNVTDIPKALREAHRVLKKGGIFVCLEFSHIDNEVLSKLYDLYSFNVIPKVGGLITGDSDSYQYLVESIRKFPDRETFSGMIKDAGFSSVSSEPLSQGIVAIHKGIKK